MPVILGDNDSVNAWLNDASVKLEEITAPYEGADLVSPCYALCYYISPCSAGGGTCLAWFCGPPTIKVNSVCVCGCGGGGGVELKIIFCLP
jgi:hypothetical protein